jgi:hypothetical protein
MHIPIIILFAAIMTVIIILLFYKPSKSNKRIDVSKLPSDMYTRVRSEPRTMEFKKNLGYSVMCSTVENKLGERFEIFSKDVLPETFWVRDGRVFANRFSNPEYKWPGT